MTVDLTLLSQVAYRGREITAPRLRGLLALLADDVRTGCSVERLVAGLWPDEQPDRPGKAVQVLVSRVRARLGADLIATTPTGYRLALAEDQVDSSALLLHAAASADRARAGDHAESLAAAEAGLALWEAAPENAPGGTGTADALVTALRAERTAARDTLVRARALALARLGRHTEASAPLAAAAARHPRDEEVLAELLRGEAATAGPSAALARYETYRRRLRDELGTEPGPGLRSVHQELLHGGTPTVRHGVPHEPNQLLGRDEDIAEVLRLLRATRAVTVVGPGGLGKTRLAHAVGRRAEQRVVHFVPLTGVTADSDVAAEVASALGAGEGRPGGIAGHTPADPVTGIRAALGTGPALLVLDNCEHVVRGAADLVHTLVATSGNLRVLATSRAPLDLSSETLYALPELSPDTSAELFTQRARAVRPQVELPPDTVAELCRHLDGLPLALELAAARVKVLSVPQIARRLGDRFALLRGAARDVPERHRTLHAVVEWSWNLLTPEARSALRTLSVFPGGFSGEAAERVLGEDALSLLEQVTDQSLLTAADTPVGVRFRMLETVREFSAARRQEAGEEETAVGRFLAWAREFGAAHHAGLVGPADPKDPASPGRTDACEDPGAARERIKPEQDNLVLALRYALARADGPTTAALTAVLAALWSTDLNYARLVALATETGPPLSHYHPEPAYVEVTRAAAVLCTAGLFMDCGPHAVRQLVTLRRLPPAPPDTLLRATALVLRALPEVRSPDRGALRELRASDQPLVVSVAECVATYVWKYEHDYDRALASAHRMIAALARVDSPTLRVIGHARLSELCLQMGRGEVAYEHLQAVLDVLPRLGGEHDYVGIRQGLALACLQRGDPDEAERWLHRAQDDGVPQQDAFYSPDLGVRAEIALARGRTETGLALWRRAMERLPGAHPLYGGDPWRDPWALEIQSAAVTAHAHAGRVDLVTDAVDRLRALLSDASRPVVELPVVGTVLHALGSAGLASGADTASAVRMLALAERMRVLREFQPTMSADRAQRAAQEADGAAYADAVSTYAALGRDGLRGAARALVLTSGRDGTGTSPRGTRTPRDPGTRRR
ncbi:ATP-binding protein [Streptomyces venezuelae]|uniref:ATP-binding protein n=1 Tax=Streptomyces venezuelae TaxID=54571 RepID=UPI0037B1D5D0